ncbi:hypothetical protein D3C71_2129440 [compost metagenome]
MPSCCGRGYTLAVLVNFLDDLPAANAELGCDLHIGFAAGQPQGEGYEVIIQILEGRRQSGLDEFLNDGQFNFGRLLLDLDLLGGQT